MKKKLLSLLIGLALMIVPSMAATGHINGCTNTGEWNNCCTKTFNITAKPGYRIVDVIVNGVSKGAITTYTFGNLTSAQVLKVITEAIQQYTITYNLDGGTVTGTNPTSYTIESEEITLVNPTKEGYTFTGWTGTGLTGLTTTVTIPKGSTGDRTYTANWEVANVAPTTPTVTLSNKTTSSFTVRAVSTDANGDSLTYKLYVDGALKNTSASTPSGTATTFSVTGLGEYTSHNYYVTVSDGTLTTTSSTQSVRTYCNTFNTKKTCADCIDGYEKCSGTSQNMTAYSTGNPCGNCYEDIGSMSNTKYYKCTNCWYQVCINCGFSTPHLCTNPGSHYPLHNNHYKCSICDGNGYIYTCSHGYTSQHN